MQVYNQKLQQFEEIPVANERKPHRLNAGYIAELKNRLTGKGYVVIYNAKEAGIDSPYGKYAVVCEEHGIIHGTTSLPLARLEMKNPEFCENCMSYEK